MDVQFVQYPNREKRTEIQAIGIVELHIPPHELNPTEICIFSQDLLTDCERIGALAFSPKTRDGSNEWRYLCNDSEDPNNLHGAHMFDFSYLKDWLTREGIYTHCPLCKKAVVEEKEQIKESEIDSMDQVKQKRDEARRDRDEMMAYFYEQLIFDKACDEYWNPIENAARKAEYESALSEVLQNWQRQSKIEEFREKIVNGAKRAITKDNISILRQILKTCQYMSHPGPERLEELKSFLDIAAERGAADCCQVLAELPVMDFGYRPTGLLNACKSANEPLANILIEAMKKTSRSFVCDDVMVEVIKKDMVDVSRKIIENRWHKPTDSDYTLAEQVGGAVWDYFRERRRATQQMMAVQESDMLLDEGWDEDDEDGDGNDEWDDDDENGDGDGW